MFFATCFSDWTPRRKCVGYLGAFALLLVLAQVFFAGTAFAEGTIYNYTYPGDSRSTRMWVPDNVGTIKGILIAGNGAGADNRGAVSLERYQLFGKLFNFAVVGTSYWGNMDVGELPMWDNNLAGLASASQHPELVNAPWAPVGLSNGGQMSYGFNALRPDKCLAFIANKGGVYDEWLPQAASLRTPGIMIAGENDEQWRRDFIHQIFTDNRARGALWSWVEEENTGHAGMAERLVLPLMAEAIRTRYPANQVPTATSGVTLKPVDESAGWLVDLSGPVTKQSEIAPVAEYTGDPSVAGWLPNQGMAGVFRAFSTYDKKVSFLSSPDVTTSKKLPLNVSLTVNTSAVRNWSKVELYDYDECLKTIFATGVSSSFVTLNDTIMDPGVHALYAVVTDADGIGINTTNVIAYVTIPEPGTLVLLGVGAAGFSIWFLRQDKRRRHILS